VVCEIEIVPELEEDTKGHARRRSMASSRRPRPICSAKKRFLPFFRRPIQVAQVAP
jgi:hypothetical protein